jgi:hypothetical protein
MSKSKKQAHRPLKTAAGAAPNTVTPFEVSARVALQAATGPYQRKAGAPLVRPLRIYTLDPSVSHRLGGVATVHVPYEDLEPGPVGSLFEVDWTGAPKPLAASQLDLDDPYLLMSAGLAPSPSNGQFHLQMVYAVCSLTYAAFRRALGRDVAWSPETPPGDGPIRLKVRPFGFRGRNAGYSRMAGDLSFGFFRARKEPAGFTVPQGLIFTALSHDVIAHETTHALLDALRASFASPTNPDVPAFHEALADLVALFLHFSYPDVVEQAIRESRGNVASASMLSELAREFGYARSSADRPSALRSAIDVAEIAPFDSDAPAGGGKEPTQYAPNLEMHAMGSVLVSAVFEAFVTIVRRKCARLFRIAGISANDIGRVDLADELVHAIAQEAATAATQFLNVCIRAIDYCPPVDMELGEYLRAMITADAELVDDDKWGYREALMRSFRRRGIFPHHVQFMTEDALKWQAPAKPLRIPGLAFSDLKFDGDPGHPASAKELRRQAVALGAFVSTPENARHFHLIAPGETLPRNITYAGPVLVQSIRCARRVSPDARIAFDLIAEVTQTCTVQRGGESFEMEGGCTIVIDPYGSIRYAIYKKLDSEDRQARQHDAMRGSLKRFWRKQGKKYLSEQDVLRRLHD